jgi:hypothetical protein
MRSQRLLLSGQPLAREFERRHISDVFKPNGSTDPQSPEYLRLVADDFQSWRLRVDGLVANPLSLSLGQLRTLPSRTQITRHDCVEGWSAIGEWKGVPLRVLLQSAGLQPEARYIVFHCADNYRNHTGPNERYYESIDLFDAFHPQTILAYDFNGGTLPWPMARPCGCGSSAAGLQARQVRDAGAGGEQPGRHRHGQGRLLGGPRRLPVVRRDLATSPDGSAGATRPCAA